MTTVYVTQEDINNGVKKDCKRCPLAKAIGRILNPNCNIEVAAFSAYVRFDRRPSKPIKLPDSAVFFISDYDSDFLVGPFSFKLDIPSEFLKNANTN